MPDGHYWVGPIGGLRPLPDQLVPVAVGRTRVGGIHTSLSGARTIDTFGYKRSWSWPFDGLTPRQTAYLDALQQNIVRGPLRLIDPRRANRLPEQIATGGGVRRTPSGFHGSRGTLTWRALSATTADPSTLPPAPLLRGLIGWVLPTTGPGTLSTVGDGPDGTWQCPVLPGETVELSLYAAGSSGLLTSLGWREYTATGAVTTHLAAGAYPVPGSWQRRSITITPAAGTVAVSPIVDIGATSQAGTLLTTAWQIAVPGAETLPVGMVVASDPEPAGGWRIGGGAPQVAVDLGDHVDQPYQLAATTFTLLET